MSVTAAAGFVAAGTAAGIKPTDADADADERPLDLAIVATTDGRPVTAAAVFTTNKATAAPVVVSRRHLDATNGMAAAIVINSGNANAATGPRGHDTAERTCRAAADQLGCDPTHVLVCSTGLIGRPLDATLIEAAMPALVWAASHHGGPDAAEAIMTTDTRPKQVTIVVDGYAIGGMAKGAAMLAPDMATMLAVVTTDADVTHDELQRALAHAVDQSFNRLTVDGCTSTNDTVVVLASGAAGPPPDLPTFRRALADACFDLASQMAHDAEGATKVVRVTVTGAATDEQAAAAARNIAESQLTKCSWYGADPYWGRIASDVGSAPNVDMDLDRLSVSYGDVTVARDGVAVPLTDGDRRALDAHMAGRLLEVTADLGIGDGESWVLTNDLTHAYVDENMGTS
jgi:glutamate N-acetyltransferase/amino-acid N-acetyltransferase